MSDGFCAAANEEQDGSAPSRANVRILTISHDESIKEDETVQSALSGRPCKQIFAWLSVGSSRMRFQLDTGATCNLLPRAHLPAHTRIAQGEKTWLVFYNGAKSTSLGTCVLTLLTKKGVQHKQTFQVVETGITPLLGAQAVQEMDLISVNFENIAALENSLSAKTGMTKESFISKFPIKCVRA